MSQNYSCMSFHGNLTESFSYIQHETSYEFVYPDPWYIKIYWIRQLDMWHDCKINIFLRWMHVYDYIALQKTYLLLDKADISF